MLTVRAEKAASDLPNPCEGKKAVTLHIVFCLPHMCYGMAHTHIHTWIIHLKRRYWIIQLTQSHTLAMAELLSKGVSLGAKVH